MLASVVLPFANRTRQNAWLVALLGGAFSFPDIVLISPNARHENVIMDREKSSDRREIRAPGRVNMSPIRWRSVLVSRTSASIWSPSRGTCTLSSERYRADESGAWIRYQSPGYVPIFKGFSHSRMDRPNNRRRLNASRCVRRQFLEFKTLRALISAHPKLCTERTPTVPATRSHGEPTTSAGCQW